VAPESLDADTDLIAQGLDSLRMMRLAGGWRKRGIDIDFARLAAAPTLDAWSEMLGGGAPAAAARSVDPTAVDPTAVDPTAVDPTAPFPLAPM
ncbi:hypothetical protein ACN94_22110, partial [Gordonia paraffinivorans]